MERTREIFQGLEVTIEKYRLNKTKVSPEDLNGRYKDSFEKLK